MSAIMGKKVANGLRPAGIFRAVKAPALTERYRALVGALVNALPPVALVRPEADAT